jgi:hypothetical protein
MRKLIKGRVIRILDKRTVIINLGSRDGIRNDNFFSILGEPESVVDPASEEELGQVAVVKARLKADRVYEKFTIATTRWTEADTTIGNLSNLLASLYKLRIVDQGDLLVDPAQVQPWKAQSEIPVQIGDIVEVWVTEKETKPEEPVAEEKSSDAENTLENE